MCTLLISIYFIIGAVFARNQYLSIMQPKGTYYPDATFREAVILLIITFILPYPSVKYILKRDTRWNWRECPSDPFNPSKKHRSFKNII